MIHKMVWWLGELLQQPALQLLLLQCPMAYISTYLFTLFKERLNYFLNDLSKSLLLKGLYGKELSYPQCWTILVKTLRDRGNWNTQAFKRPGQGHSAPALTVINRSLSTDFSVFQVTHN